MKKIEFETFRNLDKSYLVSQLKQDFPDCINFLSYRKFKVTIELVEESNDVLIERLNGLLKIVSGFNRRNDIKKEIEKLKTDGNTIQHPKKE